MSKYSEWKNKIDRSKINLLAGGPNKLRVGDRVRLYSNRSATIVSITAAAMRNCIPPPIVGQYDHNGNTITRTWHADGLWIAVSNSNHDIVAIIRPARSELMTEENTSELAKARWMRQMDYYGYESNPGSLWNKSYMSTKQQNPT